ncbi:MAG TPA: type II secretion system protein [Solirubrobacterales bacterium]
MLSWFTERADGRRGEAGFTIIEVLVAALILAIASMATFGVLASTVRNTQRAKATQVAINQAQQELEKLHSLSYDQLALTVTPSYVSSTLNPNHRVVNSNGTFALQRDPQGEYATMVVNKEEGVVTPGPIPFESGDVTGKLYRYVVWRNDPTCAESTVEAEDFCPGPQDFKQIVVAVKLDTPGNQSGERGYYEVQSGVIDPDSLEEGAGGEGGGGSGGEGGGGGGGGGSAHTGTAVTAQQFFLTDTACAADGSTEREEIEADHLLHNTLGTCASGPQTGSTIGAPDALLLGAPPDPDPVDDSNPSLFDYANDGYLEPTPDTDKGVQIKRDDTPGCFYTPTGTVNPQSQAHRWVSDPLADEFTMNGKVTLEFYTRTLNDALYHGRLCVFVFKRDTTDSTDTIFHDSSTGTEYWTYTPQGNGFWPRNSWTKVRLTMELAGTLATRTILAGERLGVALGVDPGETDAEAIPVMYDHPDYPTRIEVDTTTPINGESG